MKNMTFRKSLTAAAVAASLGFPALAVAQDAQQSTETEQAEEQMERIVTTGSRIARPELSQAAPILSLGEEDIEKFGSPDLGQILAELPAVGATNTLIGNRESNASAGVSSADLRRLGANRTLVLVDGKRHVAGSPGSASVDLSTIPSGMIERIEIMTGGASAIYGSDAVSGVINVILKKNYEGFEISGQAAGSTEGVGARTHEFTFLGGGDFMNGRGNATFYAGMNRIQETMASDVRQFNSWGTILNPEDTGRLDGIPDRIYAEGIASEYISGGGVLLADDFYGFFPDGSWQRQPAREGTNSALFGQYSERCETCLYTEDYVNLQPNVNRVNVGSSLSFEMSDSARFYSDFKYTQADIEQQFQPSFTQAIQINVADNPYLDEELRTNLLDAGIQQADFWKFFEDWGNRTADNRRELFRFNGGVDGALELGGSYLQYDFYYGYGETRNRRQTLRSQIPGNVLAAVDTIEDADGNIVCRDPDAGQVNNGGECVPYNPFGDQASQAAIDFMSADVTRDDKITQEYAGASFVTDTANFFSLQGGPVDIAVGFEWREETSETITDEFTRRGLTRNAATPNEYGEYDVTEGFVELNLPILAGLDFAEELTLDMAYRSADYSHAGSADAWKLGFMYAPIKDVRFRGTVGVAVRAPNITEAFSPRSPGFANVTDPCDQTRIDNDPNRAANCAALGVPENFESVTNASIDLISGGNPNLEAEESDSTTFGVVWTPSFIENFSVTLDYYDIEIEDAITFIDPQDVINNCVDSSSGIGNTFCSQVTRDGDSQLTAVESGYLNAAAIQTSGYEMEVNYQTELGQFDLPGSLSTSLFINHLKEFVEYPFQDQPTQDQVSTGEVGDPEWQFRFSANYRLDDLNVSWTTRFLDRSALFDVTPRVEAYENVGPAYVGSIMTHDIAVGYHFTEELRVTGGIRNMFDKVPPGYVENALYDLTGRRAYVNFTYSF
ncbi:MULTISPECIES: TonB-dependent receptor [unclassified Idiomarina]|uniref:TonB-dependent receptor domain-containing protein n=4 Tax=Idiomarina TaxID=135575 RepID=UPI00257C81D9|nr:MULTISPECIES: TonB-dependent receptor [unclassified Idiomarina]|tara:strand:+ start:12242 stop:15112 length:2871 start_codon:yes stop_codon:yes gene_type:complete